MCHYVHMKPITIRELHLETGHWVRHAATGGVVIVTDRGRRIAALQPFDAFNQRSAFAQPGGNHTQAVESAR
jgi:prevent-host-death family protein